MSQPLARHFGFLRIVTCSHLADEQLFVPPCMGTSQRPCLNCGDDILPHQEEHVVRCVHCSSPLHHNCVRPHMLREHSSRTPDSLNEHPSRPVDRPPPADRPPQPLQLAAAESQPSGEGTPCAEEKMLIPQQSLRRNANTRCRLRRMQNHHVQADSKERRWRPGLNELGLTMCSACGRDGKL